MLLAGLAAGVAARVDARLRSVIRIAAASDLQPVLPGIVAEFERTHPRLRVETMYGSSGILSRQIEQGAPFDLFTSAGRSFVERLDRARRLQPRSRQVYATGRIAVALSLGSPSPTDPEELLRHEFKRIAIANPALAPYGAAAQQALQRSDLAQKLKSRLVLAENVRQAEQFLRTGNVDAAFLSGAQVRAARWPHLLISRTLHDPIIHEMAIVADCREALGAAAFEDFLLSKPVQRRLTAAGYEAPVG